MICIRQITDQVPKGLKSGSLKKNEEILRENFSPMGNGILRGVLSTEY